MDSTTRQNFIDRIDELTKNNRVASAMDFVDVVGLSARMAVLGDDLRLRMWWDIYENSSLPPLVEIFTRRAEAGVFDLHEMLGERLALAIIEAQDAYCFLQTEESRLLADVVLAIRHWADEADLVSLDTEAAAFLREWLEVYPLPEEFRLRNLIAPKSKAEWQMLGKCSPRRRSKTVTLGADGKIETADGTIYVSEHRTPTRREVRITDADGQPVFVRRVRAGFLPAVQDRTGKWILRLDGFDQEAREKLLHTPLELTLLRGQRLVVQSQAQLLNVRMTWNTPTRAAAPMIVYACDSGEEETVGPPPAHWVPFVGVGGGGGALGFLSVDSVPNFGQSRDTGKNDELRRHAYSAAEFVFDLFRLLDYDLGGPAIDLHFPPGEGSSLSLPAMMAALARILGITWPRDIIATGCFDANNKTLEPVAAESLQTKFDVARKHGYTRIVLVDGQPNVPQDAAIEVVRVSTDPLIALFDLLKLAENVDESESRAARLLAVFANKQIRRMPFPKIEEMVSRFCESESRLVQHVACDILSRAALHEGKTEDAEKYSNWAGQLKWHEIPSDWLGHYIRYQETALRAMLAIYGGNWDRKHDAHLELNQRLGVLATAKRRGCADADDLFAMLTLYNTRAHRKQFLARMRQDKRMLLHAWDDFLRLFAEWDELFAYCEQIGRTDSTFERQRNYCLFALADARRLGVSQALLPKRTEFLQRLDENGFARADAGDAAGFDLAAWPDWHFVTDKTPSEKEVDDILKEADTEYATNKNRPHFLVYEKLLRYGYVTETQRSHCVSQLAQAAHLTPAPTSIFTLLALRTREVLAQNGRPQKTKPVRPNAGTPLRDIYDDLLSDENTLIERTPY